MAWQERKAESFVFTPLFCGYAYRHSGPAPPPSTGAARSRATADDRYAYESYGGSVWGPRWRSPALRPTRTWATTRPRR